MKARPTARALWTMAAAVAFVAASPFAWAETNYVYQRVGMSEPGRLKLEYESAVGTREARPFGRDGVEQGGRLRYGITDRVNAEAGGAALFASGTTRGLFTAEVNGLVLKQDRHFVNLTLGAGYLLDYETVSAARMRYTLGRAFGRLEANFNGLLEVPFAGDRDVVDFIIGLASSYGVVEWFRPGVEVLMEDVEGFWEEEEAEGGAKLVAGPTLWFQAATDIDIKINGAVVVAATQNAPTRTVVTDPQPPGTGFIGRLTLGYRF